MTNQNYLTIPISASRNVALLKQPKSIILFSEIYTMLKTNKKFFMSTKTLAERLNAGYSTVQKHLALLEETGFIERKNIRYTNSYRVVTKREISLTNKVFKEADSKCSNVYLPVSIANELIDQPRALILMAEIFTMLKNTGVFFKSNTIIAKNLHCSTKSVKRYLTFLEEKEFITRQNIYGKDSKVIVKREITPGEKLLDKIRNTIFTLKIAPENSINNFQLSKKSKKLYKDISSETWGQERIIESNIKNNNININKNMSSSKSYDLETRRIPYADIINYLNEKAGTHYRVNTKKTRYLIKRLFVFQKFTLDDFKKVIDKKVAEWKNNAVMTAYLRPDTLFGDKFEIYLNAPISRKNGIKRVNKAIDWDKKAEEWHKNHENKDNAPKMSHEEMDAIFTGYGKDTGVSNTEQVDQEKVEIHKNTENKTMSLKEANDFLKEFTNSGTAFTDTVTTNQYTQKSTSNEQITYRDVDAIFRSFENKVVRE